MMCIGNTAAISKLIGVTALGKKTCILSEIG